MEEVTSRRNPLAVHIRRLGSERKYRRACGSFLCEGDKLVEEALRWGAEVETLVCTRGSKPPAGLPEGTRLVQVPEGRKVFAEMSVQENLEIGAFAINDREKIEKTLESIYQHFPRLRERRKQLAGTLSGGEQQMLAMGRALMSKPKLIVMDEPSMGLSPIFVNEIFDIIQEISRAGTTVLLVEQNAKKALNIADRAYVLETGTISLSGSAKDLLDDDSVKKAYLGE